MLKDMEGNAIPQDVERLDPNCWDTLVVASERIPPEFKSSNSKRLVDHLHPGLSALGSTFACARHRFLFGPGVGGIRQL